MTKGLRRALVAGSALAALAAPVAHADVVEVGEERDRQETYQYACASWSDHDASGWSDVRTCAYEDVEGGSAQLWAVREACSSTSGRTECTTVEYESAVAPDAVDIDVSAGEGHLAATIDDCVIDVSLVADDEAYSDTWSGGGGLPELSQGRLEVRHRGEYDQWVSSTVTGSVCGWAETAGDGHGWMAEGGRDDQVTYIRPGWATLAPAAEVTFGTSESEHDRNGCGRWVTEDSGAWVEVGACGYVDAEGATSLYAHRLECTDDGGPLACTYSFDWSPVAGPGAVVVDIDAGHGRLLGAAGECAVDVIIATEGSSTYTTGSQLPQISPTEGGVTLSQPEGTVRQSDGTATGSVCDWTEASGTGHGELEAWGQRSDDTTVRPVMPPAPGA